MWQSQRRGWCPGKVNPSSVRLVKESQRPGGFSVVVSTSFLLLLVRHLLLEAMHLFLIASSL